MSAPPFKVKAAYEYNSPHDDDLSFPNGQVIMVTEEEDADWYIGEFVDSSGTNQQGLFPKNFVEKYEPAPPPRPVRAPKVKQEIPAEPTPEVTSPSIEKTFETNDDTDLRDNKGTGQSDSVVEAADPSTEPVKTEAPPEPTPEPVKATPSAKLPPPAVAEKPSSFRDRIAAFNKTSAAPIKPVKPSSQSSGGGFIQKPFVAPPPSRDAYVPSPRASPPQKVYRREEDPEIAERQAQDLADAESAGLVQRAEATEDGEEAPKPISLKDRIALLQKQQMEQAARRADVALKEKPKKSSRKRTDESNEESTQVTDADGASLQKSTSRGSGRKSIESSRDMARTSVDSTTYRSPRMSEVPAREMLSDENDADQSGAGDTTEDAERTSTSVEDSDERPRVASSIPKSGKAPDIVQEPKSIDEEDDEAEGDDNDEEDDEDEVDAETRRRMEIRERMAKMSGGMGMAGMFGPAGGVPVTAGLAPKKKQSSGASTSVGPSETSAPRPAQRSITLSNRPEVTRRDSERTEVAVEKEAETPSPAAAHRDYEDLADGEGSSGEPEAARSSMKERTLPITPPALQRTAPPPLPGDRPVPPTPRSRALPPPPPVEPESPDTGADSDDEMPESEQNTTPLSPMTRGAPPVPIRPASNLSSPSNRASGAMDNSAVSSPTAGAKRLSQVPPIPVGSPQISLPSELRPPPPPPPTMAPPSRQPTGIGSLGSPVQGANDEGESDYEGDYDTDIASSAPHKDALKAHAKDYSLGDSTFSENASTSSPAGILAAVPPPVPTIVQRAPPPPPPHQPPKASRQSIEVNRAPPPIPPARDTFDAQDDDEYDPYKYPPSSRGVPVRSAPIVPGDAADVEEGSISSPSARPFERLPDPPQSSTPADRSAPSTSPVYAVPVSSTARPRHSTEMPRTSMGAPRKSYEQSRASSDQSFIAHHIDLGEGTLWWIQPNTPPPVFQNRNDILYEMEESTTSKRGGRTLVSKDVYILFMDYSQTIITARFDAKDPSDVSFEQRNQPPPARMRQDELEAAYTHFGQKIAEAATSKQNNTVGDGSPIALILELLQPFSSALLPVGARAFGALVYVNMANATVQQFDEIRPGDIVTFRNAKFQGKHGAMHQKYSLDVGKPDHVGVVVDWDGTKKKVRAWEQGREGSRKVKVESFRVGDLRSGEVRVWRVMSRAWVGWEGSN